MMEGRVTVAARVPGNGYFLKRGENSLGLGRTHCFATKRRGEKAAA